MDYEVFFMFLVSFIISISFVTMLAACLCCRKKIPKNELLGLEGMVKLKNPDENINNGNDDVSLDPKTTANDIESKRASNAPHRSLPDIPVSEPIGGDTGSDLYATVGDKVIEKPQGRSPSIGVQKLASVSQHSSLSQADDVSSPYARVRSPPHAYDKVKSVEHPYAQLKAGPSITVQNTQQPDTESNEENLTSRRGSNQSLLETTDGHLVIPAASAIAGRISASQELPYMTPPIPQPQQNFSGDSQDSSKGYTSISVREPLANIIAQTKQQNAQARRRDLTDSHYATVSDDSDEMYAAIDDPNNQTDLYTSGSETYAQIQPPVALTVAVEINPTPSSIRLQDDEVILNSIPHTANPQRQSMISVQQEESLIPAPVDNLKTVHSRQASSSSCTSSVGNLGSPKPEKRQANSPLPPTPKNSHYLSNSNLTNTSSIPSGRNSAASVIECVLPASNASRHVSRENLAGESVTKSATLGSTNRSLDKYDDDSTRKKQNPSKDLEGMYAKVMKKNKFSNAPSQNSSPIPNRKSLHSSDDKTDIFSSDPDISADIHLSDNLSKSVHSSPSKTNIEKSTISADNNYETIDKRRNRINIYDTKDPGYETIPADKPNSNASRSDNYEQMEKRRSAPSGHLVHGLQNDSQNATLLLNKTDTYCDTTEPGYESLPHQSNINDPGYETVSIPGADLRKPNSDYDPNYEVLRPADSTSDGYSKVWETSKSDGYSSIKSAKRQYKDLENVIEQENIEQTGCNIEPGYSSIDETAKSKNHDYARIAESKKNYLNNNIESDSADIYTSIQTEQTPSYLSIQENTHHDYSTISETQSIYLTESQTITANKIMNTSGYSSISDTKTTPSSDSNSSDAQIEYSGIRSEDGRFNSSSNYESLTGSESDPNYESVRYIDVKENPYERLHNDIGISPDAAYTRYETAITNVDEISQVITKKDTPANSDNLEVGDYFQV